jgi:hypothetical protein
VRTGEPDALARDGEKHPGDVRCVGLSPTGEGMGMALVRDLVIVAGVGPDYCGAVDLLLEEGTEIGKAECIGLCISPSAGYLRHIDAGICAYHIAQADELGGVHVLE